MRVLPLPGRLKDFPHPEKPFSYPLIQFGKLRHSIKKFSFIPAVFLAFSLSFPAQAENFPDNAQKKLNEQILNQPFNVPDETNQRETLEKATEEAKPGRSKTKDRYYRYWFNGYYYPYPNSYYGFPTFQPGLGL